MQKHGILTTVILAGISLSLGGCSSSRESDVPGRIEPGSIEDVSNRASGSGGSIQGLSVIPLTGRAPAQIPVIRAPECITFYVFPRESRDGLAYRHGCYISAVKKPFSWGEKEIMQNNRLQLSSLSNMRIDQNGQLVIDGTSAIVPTAETVQGLRTMGGNMPWRAGDRREETTTTVVFPNGNAVQSTAPNTQAPNYVNNGNVSLNEVQRAIQDASTRLRQAQQLQQPPVNTQNSPQTPPQQRSR